MITAIDRLERTIAWAYWRFYERVADLPTYHDTNRVKFENLASRWFVLDADEVDHFARVLFYYEMGQNYIVGKFDPICETVFQEVRDDYRQLTKWVIASLKEKQ